jgi:hypothetical protein
VGSGPPLVNGVQLTGINIGSTDSQRGGIFAYSGTNSASCNRGITALGLGTASFATILNDSPNNSSLHLSGPIWVSSLITNCTLNWGGSAHATNILDGAISDTGNLGPTPGAGIVTNVINGSIWQLTAVHTYTGPTLVTNGTGAGISGDVLVQKNGVLGGTGTINNNVQVLTNGTLSPGDFAIGTLTINGNLTNAGTLFMELNKTAGTNDRIAGVNILGYGGILAVTNLAGSLTTNDSFKLFSATNYVGSFSSVSPATPGSGLAWDLSALPTTGTLKITTGSAPSPTQITNIVQQGTNVIIAGGGGSAGGTYYLRSSTNLALPTTSWQWLSTNLFDANGNFNLTNSIEPQTPARFYRIDVLVP